MLEVTGLVIGFTVAEACGDTVTFAVCAGEAIVGLAEALVTVELGVTTFDLQPQRIEVKINMVDIIVMVFFIF